MCINGFSRKLFVRPLLNTYIFNSGVGKLFFSEVTDADNGYYYCVATLTNVNENNNYEGATQPPAKTSRGILLNVTEGCEYIKPFLISRPVHRYSLDEPFSSFRGFW